MRVADHPIAIDAPTHEEPIAPPSTPGGWALAGEAMQLRDLYVHAYPVDGSEPWFVGEAGTGGARRDVANRLAGSSPSPTSR